MNKRIGLVLASFFVALALIALLALAAGGEGLLAAGGEAPEGTAAVVPPYIYYQGRLTDPDTGDPVANGTYSMTFRLYTQAEGGAPLALDTRPVTVAGGLFRSYIGFPAENYDGQALWVGVQVAPDPEMTPRHYLRPVPYALSLRPGAVVSGSVGVLPTLKLVNNGAGRALQAEAAGWSAVLATNDSGSAATVAGVNLGSAPGGYFASGGADALRVDGSALIEGDLTVLGAVWAQSSYRNVLVVAPQGGDYASIQAALDSIGDAAEDNPWLVRVMPGTYEEQVTLKPWVTVQGSGPKLTVISYTVATAYPVTSGTVIGADDATLADLSVVNHAPSDGGAAIYNSYVEGMTLEGVAALSDGGGDNYAIYNDYASPEIRRCLAVARDGTNATGIKDFHSSAPLIEESTVLAAGATGINIGIWDGESSSSLIRGSTVMASGGAGAWAVSSQYDGSPVIERCTLGASDSSDPVGVRVYFALAEIVDTAITVSGPGATGVYAWSDSEVAVRGSAVVCRDSGSCDGVLARDSSEVAVEDSVVSASATSRAYAITTEDLSHVTLTRCSLWAGNGAGANRGVVATDQAIADVRFSTVTAVGGITASGVDNRDGGAVTLDQSVISATLGTTSYGVYNYSADAPITVTLNLSQVRADDWAIYNADADYTVRSLGTLLVGGVNTTGTYLCVNSFDETGLLGLDCQ